MEESRTTQLAVSLPLFDGPLALLLALVRRNEYSIHNVPVVEITGQFLAYVRTAKSLDVDMGGEFAEVASWLVLLKSRSILPEPEEARGVKPQEELRQVLMQQEELERATAILGEKAVQRAHAYGAPAASAQVAMEGEVIAPPTAEDVASSLRRAQGLFRELVSLSAHDPITVEDQIEWVRDQVSSAPGISFSTLAWFEWQPDDAARAVLLLALLELARIGVLIIHQTRPNAPILIKSVAQVNKELTHEKAGLDIESRFVGLSHIPSV